MMKQVNKLLNYGIIINMRKRNEIETEVDEKGTTRRFLLEVLLDIRDLLKKNK